MSTGGLLFRGAIQLPIGELIEVVMAWPFLLNENQVLELRLRGMIVRSTPAETAISISKHEIHPAPEPEG